MKVRYPTPDGFDDLLLQSDGEVLTGVSFVRIDDEYDLVSQKSIPAVLRDSCRWFDIYFSGRQPDFTPEFRLSNATPFRKEVLELLNAIPFGKTTTYGEIAALIARNHGIAKMSAQAVGGAVGWNPIGIIIPCHRVIGANGKLTGYGGGIKNKIALLQLEKSFYNTDGIFTFVT